MTPELHVAESTLVELRTFPILDHPLIWITLRGVQEDWGHLHQLIRNASRAQPDAPVVINVPDVPAQRLVWLAWNSDRIGARAVLVDSASEADLRCQLTSHRRLPLFISQWFRNREMLPVGARSCVQTVIGLSRSYRTLSEAQADGKISQTAVRRLLRRRGVPPPGAWFKLGLAVRIGLSIQRCSTSALDQIHRSLGFSDPSSVSHFVQRQFHWSVRDLRRKLGLEPLLQRWCQHRAEGHMFSPLIRKDDRLGQTQRKLTSLGDSEMV
jgi:hypothetical protein